MYINKEQLLSRLKGQANLNVRAPHRRKEVGTKNLTHEQKVLIGTLTQVDSQANVARELGVSPATVSNIARGLDASKRQDEVLSTDVNKNKEDISNKALDVLMQSIGVVKSKIGSAKTASEAAIVARNMAVVANSMVPSGPSGNNGPRILININGPKSRDEHEYEVIDVNGVSQ